MAWLEEIGRRQEGVIPIEGIHKRQVILILINQCGQIREVLGYSVAESAAGEKARFSGRRLDRHTLEDGFERAEFGGEVDDGIHSGQKSPGG